MQQSDEKTKELANVLGQILKEMRESRPDLTLNRLANEYALYKGTLSKIERGKHNFQFVTLWKISEALGIKCSELVRLLEDRLGEEFTLIDE